VQRFCKERRKKSIRGSHVNTKGD